VEATVGNIEEAKAYLSKGVEFDSRVRLRILDDPLLERVW
jgi:hypothetical protein